SAAMTGASALRSKQVMEGAIAYFEFINSRGGVHGRTIKLVTLDDGGKTDKAIENTRQLIEQERVFALFGYATRNSAEAAAPIAAETGTIFFGAATGGSLL